MTITLPDWEVEEDLALGEISGRRRKSKVRANSISKDVADANFLGDVEWLMADGLPPETIARRLGFTLNTLEIKLSRLGRSINAVDHARVDAAIDGFLAKGSGYTFFAADLEALGVSTSIISAALIRSRRVGTVRVKTAAHTSGARSGAEWEVV
ncbi:hypothetical protein [Nocardia niigatensis]